VLNYFNFPSLFFTRNEFFSRTFHNLWQTCETHDNTLTVFFFAFFERFPGFSNIYLVIVIALSCLVLVLLIAVSLLTWRFRRAGNNKREKTPQRDTSDEVERHGSRRDQHIPEELSYMELKPGPLEELPQATQNYQSLQGANLSSAYYNAGYDIALGRVIRRMKFTTATDHVTIYIL